MAQITIIGSVPSKKNSRKVFLAHGRLIFAPSTNYEKWHKEALKQLPHIRINPTHIEITIFAPDKRKADLTNKAESVMDAMVDAGILEDDNWFVCNDIRLKFGGVDRE